MSGKFKPGDKVLVLAGSINKGVVATFTRYGHDGKCYCWGPGSHLYRIHISPEKLRLVKRQVAPTG